MNRSGSLGQENIHGYSPTLTNHDWQGDNHAEELAKEPFCIEYPIYLMEKIPYNSSLHVHIHKTFIMKMNITEIDAFTIQEFVLKFCKL